MMMKIYHNPRCRKSRETLALLEESNAEFEVINYLESPPSKTELKEVLELLQMQPFDLLRRGEEIFKTSFKGKNLSADEWIDVMVSNPKLIERPIVVKGNQAVIGRPPENVKQLL